MDTIDKIIVNMARDGIEMTRDQVETKLANLGETPEEHLADLESFDDRVEDPEYMKADPTGVVNMDKFSEPLTGYHVGQDDKDKS